MDSRPTGTCLGVSTSLRSQARQSRGVRLTTVIAAWYKSRLKLSNYLMYSVHRITLSSHYRIPSLPILLNELRKLLPGRDTELEIGTQIGRRPSRISHNYWITFRDAHVSGFLTTRHVLDATCIPPPRASTHKFPINSTKGASATITV